MSEALFFDYSIISETKYRKGSLISLIVGEDKKLFKVLKVSSRKDKKLGMWRTLTLLEVTK